jgi:Spx/MgsR family transcriptional regulator
MTTSITLYGIPNCNTVKMARSWLSYNGASVNFHDFKKQGMPTPLLQGWVAAAGWQTLVNRKGSTWRNLTDVERLAVVDAPSAIALICKHPSVVKRPVVVWRSGLISVGFDATKFAQHLAQD